MYQGTLSGKLCHMLWFSSFLDYFLSSYPKLEDGCGSRGDEWNLVQAYFQNVINSFSTLKGMFPKRSELVFPQEMREKLGTSSSVRSGQ